MPATRIIYSLEDIKKLLSRIHHVEIERVQIFENEKLLLDTDMGELEITDNHYIFQVLK
jgi:hypothetical protein